MSYKYFGRLAGSALTDLSTLDDTTIPDRRSPYVAQSTATKLFAPGEHATARSMNRVAGALSSNIDFIAGYLDTPALREDILHYYTDSGVNSGKFGFPALAMTNPGDTGSATSPLNTVSGTDYTQINLGGHHATDLIEPPPIWLYVGAHERSLTNGSVMRLYKDSQADLYDTDGSASPYENTMFSSEVIPAFISRNSTEAAAGTEYHAKPTGSTGYLGSESPHAPTDSIAPILPVATDLPPYLSSSLSPAITSWSEQGPTISAYNWGGGDDTTDGLLLRPGCFVRVSGSTDNDGLYLLRSFVGGTAVLTRGGLTEVSVVDSSIFEVGEMVGWAAGANYNATGLTIDERQNRAYVVHKDATNHIVWLYHFSGSEHYITEDSGAGTTTGGRATSTVDAAASDAWEAQSYNEPGLLDGEDSATDNWNLRVGTVLYTNVFDATLTGTTATTVTDVVGPNAPLRFSTSGTPGTAQPCNPPGFLLNPVISVENDYATGTYLRDGNYLLRAKTLTTVREQLASGGMAASEGENDNPSSMMSGHDNDWFMKNMKSMFWGIHFGYQRSEPLGNFVFNDWDQLTRNILGGGVWYVEADFGGTGIGTKVTDGTIVIGDLLGFEHPGPGAGFGDAYGTVVGGWGDSIILRDVFRYEWDLGTKEADLNSEESIVTGSIATVGGDDYTVTIAYRPEYSGHENWVDPSTPNSETPLEVYANTLNAAYNSLLSASHWERDHGLGNMIRMFTGRPITMVARDTGVEHSFLRASFDSGDDASLIKTVDEENLLTINAVDNDATNVNLEFSAAHGLSTGDKIVVIGHDGGSPDDLNGEHVVTRVDATNVTVPANNSGGSTTGATAYQVTSEIAIDSTTSALTFRDLNTHADIPLTDTSTYSGAISSTITGSIVGGINTLHVFESLERQATRQGLHIDGCIASNPGTGDVDVSVGWYSSSGYIARIEGDTVSGIVDGQSYYLFIDVSGVGSASFAVTQTMNDITDEDVLLYRISRSSSTVTMDYDYRAYRSYDRKFNDHVTVGPSFGNFDTLDEAVEYCRAYMAPDLGGDGRATMTIEVVESTTELSTVTVDFDNLTIIGRPGAQLTFSGTAAGIELDSVSNVVLRGLTLHFDSTSSDDASGSKIAISQINTDAASCVFENITITSDGASPTDTCWNRGISGDFDNCRFTNISIEGASDYGMYLTSGSSGTVIDGVRAVHKDAKSASIQEASTGSGIRINGTDIQANNLYATNWPGVAGGIGGVFLECDESQVTNVRVDNTGTEEGLVLNSNANLSITGVRIHCEAGGNGINASGILSSVHMSNLTITAGTTTTDGDGIKIQATAVLSSNVTISNFWISGFNNDTTSYGIYISDVDKARISDGSISGSGGAGIVWNDCDRGSITGVTIEGAGAAYTSLTVSGLDIIDSDYNKFTSLDIQIGGSAATKQSYETDANSDNNHLSFITKNGFASVLGGTGNTETAVV